MSMVVYKTREEWLVAAVDEFRQLFEQAGEKIPEKVKVSMGFPAKGGMRKRMVIGVCYKATASKDGVCQIYINPVLDTLGGADGILGTLVHELVHACGKHGHGKEFRSLATAVGLEGRMASSIASDWLQSEFDSIILHLGEFPHAGLILSSSLAIGQKPDKCRMHKCECSTCGYTARIANKWIEVGVPKCPACDIELQKQ